MSSSRKFINYIIILLFAAILLAAILISGTTKNETVFIPHFPDPPKTLPVTQDSISPESIDTLFSFEIRYDSTQDGVGDWYDTISSIGIIRKADYKKIQTVFPPAPGGIPVSMPLFQLEDMNFDGYLDFRVVSFMMTRGQTFYNFWLYDPKKGKFAADTFMSNNLWDAEFDHKGKTVISNQRLAGGPFNGVNEVYTWENGKLILQHKEECEQNPFGEDCILTMTKRINGKLIGRSKKFDSIPLTGDWQIAYDWDKLK